MYAQSRKIGPLQKLHKHFSQPQHYHEVKQMIYRSSKEA